MSEEIHVKIVGIDSDKCELEGVIVDGDKVRIDPCVGCNIPHSFFDLLDMSKLIGKVFYFEGHFFKGSDKSVFLSSAFADKLN